MEVQLAALSHPHWKRFFLVLFYILGSIYFLLRLLPRALRVAQCHIWQSHHCSRNIKYSTRGVRNVLDVYRVEEKEKSKEKGSHPVVVFCHGGAWNSYVLFSQLSHLIYSPVSPSIFHSVIPFSHINLFKGG